MVSCGAVDACAKALQSFKQADKALVGKNRAYFTHSHLSVSAEVFHTAVVYIYHFELLQLATQTVSSILKTIVETNVSSSDRSI
jgi:hypothetical protein